jgi:hypothetical protein
MPGIRRLVSLSLLAAALGIPPATALAQDASTRTYSAGQFVLELDGAQVGVLRGVEGGEAVGDVVTSGSMGGFANKHIGGVKYSDFTLEVGTGMEAAFYDWITAFWDAKAVPKTGAVLTVDYNSQVVARREFQGALLTETILPTLDAASKDPAFITARFAPERVRMSKGGGSVPSMTTAKAQRPWSVSNFRLEITGLDCSHVRKIESFSVKQKVIVDAGGGERGGQKVPGALTVSDLVVTMPEMFAETWDTWAQAFLVEGRRDDSQEKIGDLVLLGSDGQSEIARVHLFGLGPLKVAHESPDSANQVRSVEATLYCERAAFEWKGGAGAVMNVRYFGK